MESASSKKNDFRESTILPLNYYTFLTCIHLYVVDLNLTIYSESFTVPVSLDAYRTIRLCLLWCYQLYRSLLLWAPCCSFNFLSSLSTISVHGTVSICLYLKNRAHLPFQRSSPA